MREGAAHPRAGELSDDLVQAGSRASALRRVQRAVHLHAEQPHQPRRNAGPGRVACDPCTGFASCSLYAWQWSTGDAVRRPHMHCQIWQPLQSKRTDVV